MRRIRKVFIVDIMLRIMSEIMTTITKIDGKILVEMSNENIWIRQDADLIMITKEHNKLLYNILKLYMEKTL